METQLEQIREQQKETWNKFSRGWKKWDDLTMEFLKPMGNEIIRLLKPNGNEQVLDVAAGTTDVYWSFMTEVVAPVVAALSKADDAMKAKIKSEVYEAVKQKYPDGKIAIDAGALVIYGEK